MAENLELSARPPTAQFPAKHLDHLTDRGVRLDGLDRRGHDGPPAAHVLTQPSQSRIDRRLVLGALAFGAGWGLAGLCPGPALALIATGNGKVLVFVASMLVGMGIFEVVERWRR